MSMLLVADIGTGIRSRMLKIPWRPYEVAADMTNFETVARHLRYRNFAYGCLDCDIKALFLGHHLSDQVETILLRLVRGQRVASGGLSGIKPVNKIPCCENLYGAIDGFEASSLTKLLGTRSTPFSTTEKSASIAESSAAVGDDPFPGDILVSHGGIKVYRPLLSFPKSRLTATCVANRIPFVTDPTNFDPETTQRNAIRLLISSNTMPMALRQDSIMRLRAASAKLEEGRSKKLIELLNSTRLVEFDIRSGRLVVLVSRKIRKTGYASEQEATYYLDRLLGLVSPDRENTGSFLQLSNIARWMFPELREAGSLDFDKPLDLRSCTARGVLINRLPGPSGHFWELSRRPFKTGEDHDENFAPAPFYSKGADRHWSGWSAWDGRYWIRIRTRDAKDVRLFKIRALQRSDLEELTRRKKRFSEGLPLGLGRILSAAAPGKIRYTLPVLVKREQLWALPTLDIKFPKKNTLQGAGRSEDVADGLEWEVRYKDITDTLQYLRKPNSGIDDVVRNSWKFYKYSDAGHESGN